MLLAWKFSEVLVQQMQRGVLPLGAVKQDVSIKVCYFKAVKADVFTLAPYL